MKTDTCEPITLMKERKCCSFQFTSIILLSFTLGTLTVRKVFTDPASSSIFRLGTGDELEEHAHVSAQR